MSKLGSLALIFPFILRWEGGFVNHKNDPGGATNKGVTLKTLRSQRIDFADKNKNGVIDVADLKLITNADAQKIFEKDYWSRIKGDQLPLAVANVLADWVWLSGSHAIKRPQRMVGAISDGIMGPKSIKAITDAYNKNPSEFMNSLYKDRYSYINEIIKVNPKLKDFQKGWINRMEDLMNFNKQYIK